MKIALHAITIMLSQMGVYVWYSAAHFEQEKWVTAYYIWDKSILVLLVICCILPMKIMRPFWMITGTFFAIRLSLELLAISTDITNILFDYRLICLINFICTALVIWKSQKCPKQN